MIRNGHPISGPVQMQMTGTASERIWALRISQDGNDCTEYGSELPQCNETMQQRTTTYRSKMIERTRRSLTKLIQESLPQVTYALSRWFFCPATCGSFRAPALGLFFWGQAPVPYERPCWSMFTKVDWKMENGHHERWTSMNQRKTIENSMSITEDDFIAHALWQQKNDLTNCATSDATKKNLFSDPNFWTVCGKHWRTNHSNGPILSPLRFILCGLQKCLPDVVNPFHSNKCGGWSKNLWTSFQKGGRRGLHQSDLDA